jgi:hypothetical protein
MLHKWALSFPAAISSARKSYLGGGDSREAEIVARLGAISGLALNGCKAGVLHQ